MTDKVTQVLLAAALILSATVVSAAGNGIADFNHKFIGHNKKASI